MNYSTIKLVHQFAVALSLAGFFVRGLASLQGATWVRGGLARTLPHVVDTVLLGSALTMAWMLRLTPDSAPWLVAKIVGLVLYIALGMAALRPGLSGSTRAISWVLALVTFGWIVSVAISKNPLGVLAASL